ncbi:MAG: insulinase family protein [Bdellovibrio sp. CG10_big_fil_rev_8_21_14_0_10_47_8]|nr:MAG: insulinase family protein [Bdellovibrio sp. CG10_big_fil_rev_8_21_14_0_10_47_8]
MKWNSLIGILLMIGLSSCATSSPRSPQAFRLRPVEQRTYRNGLKVLFIPDHTLPKISFAMVLPSGASADPKGEEGLMSLMVALLDQGAAAKSAMQVADDFAQLGSSFHASVAQDYTVLSTSGLSQYHSELLDLFAEIVTKPAFQNEEVERKKSQFLSKIQQLQDQPGPYADLKFSQELYQGSVYGRPILGTEATLGPLSRTQVIKQYFEYFRPNNAILAVMGDFDDNMRADIGKAFGGWVKADVTPPPKSFVQASSGNQYKIISKPGLKQAQIHIGQLGIPRNHPDFLKLRLANVILGGDFASRLNQKVRDDLGLTYSISSQLETYRDIGGVDVSTFTRQDKVAETILNSIKVIRDFQEKGVTEEELASAKALMIGQFPAAIETVDRLALNMMLLRVYGVSDSYLRDYIKNVNAITLKDLNETIARYIKPDQLKVLVYANEKELGSQLKSVGKFQSQAL